MANGNEIDQALVQLLTVSEPATINDVIQVMENIDNVLPSNDGLKWFNLLYLMVTKAVRDNPPANGWNDPQWLNRLDVIFANLYFAAIVNWAQDPPTTPRAWRALLEARDRAGVARVQFALCGMNAHINHDLPLAVVQAGEELQLTPDRNSPQHSDFEHVNVILEAVEPQAMQHLATGIIGQIAQNLGRLRQVLAMWNVRQARETAWTNAEILWQIRNITIVRNKFLRVLDKMTGFAGRGLLIPVEGSIGEI
jgi:hypothetical protein